VALSIVKEQHHVAVKTGRDPCMESGDLFGSTQLATTMESGVLQLYMQSGDLFEASYSAHHRSLGDVVHNKY
jgi:hypothetical protein